MPRQDRLEARRPIIDFYDFPGERVETRFQAQKPVFEVGKPGLVLDSRLVNRAPRELCCKIPAIMLIRIAKARNPTA